MKKLYLVLFAALLLIAPAYASSKHETSSLDAGSSVIYGHSGTNTIVPLKVTSDGTVVTSGGASDTAYGSSWDGVTTIPPSKNAVYDKIETIHVPTASKSFVVTNPDANADFPLWRAPANITVTGVHVLCIGGTNIVGQLYEYDSNGANGSTVDADITATAGTNANDDGSLSNAAIASGNYVGWKTTSVSGSPTQVIITFDYTQP